MFYSHAKRYETACGKWWAARVEQGEEKPHSEMEDARCDAGGVEQWAAAGNIIKIAVTVVVLCVMNEKRLELACIVGLHFSAQD